MSATHGAWDAPVDNAIPTETIRYPIVGNPGLSTLDDRDLFVIHAALLHTGKVLWFSGHAEFMHYAEVSFVFDPNALTLTRVPFPTGMDLFCCHFAQLEDGRLLVVGGSDPDFNTHGSRGARNIVLFDPMPSPGFPAGRWKDTNQKLLQGRWYPTLVTLGDGRVLVFSGRLERGRANAPADIANWVEVLSPPDFTPRRLTGVDMQLPLYPGLHLGRDGRVYYTHTNWGQQIVEPGTTALTITGPTSGTWAPPFPSSAIEPRRREEGMSVLLPPAQDGKILVVGGSEARNSADMPVQQAGGAMDHIASAADATRATILNTAPGVAPTWTAAPGGGATNHPRINGHLVLLPDATVLVCGGHDHYKWNNIADGTDPSLIAEIFTPGGATPGFRDVAGMAHPRMYHSAALLLPDGSVVVAGGADPNLREPTLPWPAAWPIRLRWGPTAYARNRKDREVYRPPYFFKGARPIISQISRNNVPTRQIPYGSTFVVTTPQAADITVVALMRPGCATHHTDSEQRYVPLIPTRAGNDLTVTMLPESQSSVAPPGFYMLWIVDNQQRPCDLAWFIQIPAPPRPVASTSSWPCIVATVAMGSADADAVRTLRRVREEIESASPAGRRFIQVVNRVYYSFSPRLAAALVRHETARLATRDVVVRPAASAVGWIASKTARISSVAARQSSLMLLLVLLAASAVLLSPLAAIGAVLHGSLRRLWRSVSRDASGHRSSDEGARHAR